MGTDRRTTTIEVVIDVEHADGSLRGRVHEPDRVQEFVGWLGLLGALGGAVDRVRRDD